jgi:hypothetical protein
MRLTALAVALLLVAGTGGAPPPWRRALRRLRGSPFGRFRVDRRPDRDAGAVVLAAELTALGLSAGLSLPTSLAAAVPHLPSELQREVRALLRRGRSTGLGPLLESSSGRGAGLYRVAGRAMTTGAPLVAAVRGYVAELRAEERSRQLERVRKLPVKLLFPLALLILPGFLVLVTAPTLLAALDRLQL